MSGNPSNLQGARGFTRGFLLAMDWAGQCPDAEIAIRVPRLRDEDMRTLYRTFRSLPRESRRAMRTTWAKRDRLRRVDETVDLHPSWMMETLREEPPALFLLALGELEPKLARSVLRELWPKMRPRPDAAVAEVRPLSPSHAGAFRRFLYARWVHLSESAGRGAGLESLLALDAGQIWLLAQEFGRKELERLGGRVSGDHPSPRVRAACAEGTDDSDENERVGLVGLHLLSSLLSRHPRQYALHMAQRMAQPVAQPFLRWRDEEARVEAAEPGSVAPKSSPFPAEEILERARSMNAEFLEDEEG